MTERRVEIGLGFQSDKSTGRYRTLARLAEDHGFDVITVFSDLLYQPPIVPLLEMARVTERVRLGVACWNPYTLHPYEIAGMLAALDQESAGRAYLGLAKGTWLDRLGIDQPRPVRYLREAAGLIYALLGGEGEGRESDIFPLAPDTTLRYPVLRSKPPLLIGTWGAQGAAMAGEIADELKVGGTANPAMAAVMRERIKVGTDKVGREPDDVRLVFGAVTVVDEDRDVARAKAREEVAMYVEAVAALDPTISLPREVLSGEVIPDDVLDLFAFSGTPDDVAAQAQGLIDAGVDRVEFGTPHGLTNEHGVDLIGRHVLPQLRR